MVRPMHQSTERKTIEYNCNCNMKEKNWGRIINISSVSVKTPVNNLFLSNSIRLGVLGWAKALSDEVGKDGITVNSVCPGSTRTNRITSIYSEMVKQTGQSLEEVEELFFWRRPFSIWEKISPPLEEVEERLQK